MWLEQFIAKTRQKSVNSVPCEFPQLGLVTITLKYTRCMHHQQHVLQ